MDFGPVAPDGGDSRSVVAMIGLHADRERVQDLMDCEVRERLRERLRAGNDLVSMVVSATAVDTFPDGHDVSAVAGSPGSRIRGLSAGGVVDLHCESDLRDLSVLDCESVEEHERNTWNDWCNSAFRTGSDGFPPGDEDTQPVVVFINRLWWDDTMAESWCL